MVVVRKTRRTMERILGRGLKSYWQAEENWKQKLAEI